MSKIANVYGLKIDKETRCIHYHSEKDVIAIKHRCCLMYYACIECHNELAGHKSTLWKKEEFHEKAVFCGACQTELTILAYLQAGFHCPNCNHPFNERCELHYRYYFELK
ncbi:CHY zinc finger protein [Bacillus sp. JCM 19034]|uniref:CHY zinc finger protein n=1 Tax=Bacillus sp. JCM 19034 TaxID=1481928 RepID=UPI000781D596|nr:CHY zinc finger protein [Bacillus sp. JCM 19034]